MNLLYRYCTSVASNQPLREFLKSDLANCWWLYVLLHSSSILCALFCIILSGTHFEIFILLLLQLLRQCTSVASDRSLRKFPPPDLADCWRFDVRLHSTAMLYSLFYIIPINTQFWNVDFTNITTELSVVADNYSAAPLSYLIATVLHLALWKCLQGIPPPFVCNIFEKM